MEMFKASPDQCSQAIAVLINTVAKEGKAPEEWNNSYIMRLFKSKNALDRGNCCGLKLKDQLPKVVERITENITRECIVTDTMQFGFMPRHRAIDAIIIVRQLQENSLDKNKNV